VQIANDADLKETSQNNKYQITVFITSRESVCDECKETLGTSAWITLDSNKKALCLSCADLDHLVFLPSGDAALTRRAGKYSTLSAVVVRWSKSRKRYERQGLLVEEQALEKAEEECLNDADVRALKRERAAEKRTVLDEQFIANFANKIRRNYSNMPRGLEKVIANHACRKYSGRVGRTQAAKEFDDDAVFLAVNAHIRHARTNYDELLAKGYDRKHARSLVDDEIRQILKLWESEK
jgi:RNase P subunit RPR2